MTIEQFMHGYKAAWEQRDESMFSALFAADGQYHNTVLDGLLKAEFEGGSCKKCPDLVAQHASAIVSILACRTLTTLSDA